MFAPVLQVSPPNRETCEEGGRGERPRRSALAPRAERENRAFGRRLPPHHGGDSEDLKSLLGSRNRKGCSETSAAPGAHETSTGSAAHPPRSDVCKHATRAAAPKDGHHVCSLGGCPRRESARSGGVTAPRGRPVRTTDEISAPTRGRRTVLADRKWGGVTAGRAVTHASVLCKESIRVPGPPRTGRSHVGAPNERPRATRGRANALSSAEPRARRNTVRDRRAPRTGARLRRGGLPGEPMSLRGPPSGQRRGARHVGCARHTRGKANREPPSVGGRPDLAHLRESEGPARAPEDEGSAKSGRAGSECALESSRTG